MSKTGLLFLNGEKPNHFPNNIDKYDIVACADGAYSNYVAKQNIALDYIIGDLDSIGNVHIPEQIKLIHTPDQNKTDFEKALLFLLDLGVTKCIIYGASGGASDHVLGNFAVALNYYQHIDLVFYDHICYFFFAKKQMTLNNIKNSTISFMPLTPVKELTITGVQYPLTHADLQLNGLVSLRNHCIDDNVTLSFTSGDLLVFITLPE